MLGHLSRCRWLVSHCLVTCGLETHTEKAPCGLTCIPGCYSFFTGPLGKKPRGSSL